jgi:hypothetical protein
MFQITQSQLGFLRALTRVSVFRRSLNPTTEGSTPRQHTHVQLLVVVSDTHRNMVPSDTRCRRHAGRVHPERNNNNTIAGSWVSGCGMDIKIVGNARDDDIV